MPESRLFLLSPCSGPVRRAAPAGVEAVVFSLAEGLRDEFSVHVLATPDSELPEKTLLHGCGTSSLARETELLLQRFPQALFCDHSGATIYELPKSRYFRVFHVEPRYVYAPEKIERCAFVSAYLRGLFAAQRSGVFASCPVLANGIPTPGVVPSSQGRSGVVYLGRLNRLKGIDIGVAACASLGVKLHVHGGFGPGIRSDIVFNDRMFLDELVQQFPANFSYHGPLLDPQAKEAILSTADAVLIPSREAESCSLVALEAVARGVPVVTFQRGGVVEYLGEHPGVFFAPHTGHDLTDIRALAAALRRALDAPRFAPSLPDAYTAPAMVARYRSWFRSEQERQLPSAWRDFRAWLNRLGSWLPPRFHERHHGTSPSPGHPRG